MTTFVFRLIPPRPTFALDHTQAEGEVVARHAAHWQPRVDAGQMVVLGPVLDGSGSWGLGVVGADDEDELRDFAGRDPAVLAGTFTIELGRLIGGTVRPLAGHAAGWTPPR